MTEPRVRVFVFVDLSEVEGGAADAFLQNSLTQNAALLAQRRGCLEYETFQSLTEPRHLHVTELWESVAAYDEHWAAQQAEFAERKGLPPRIEGIRVSFEFYQQQLMQYTGEHWVSVDDSRRSNSIWWP
ncbi:putative quinol monooxygenase [Subtercola endophyticus]|uniref:putative quinol monooxygenase n=1 Tax=Subtercola endophyticus TaxID=2895559 RepID=UPI001E310575|nr:antibiotic biosynthesis monooxygenase family protein [Subtercola endophyticus]UFS58777.1 antibiotic biosynthesis monooxygenase [Subtercola endophyticus]